MSTIAQLEVTVLSNKRIRSGYQRKILNWLVDSGGSVSQISKSLGIRTPHTSLALSQLREKGYVFRDDTEGIRGALHKITERGRQRLDDDYLALYKIYAKEISPFHDAVVLDSKGSVVVLCYMKNPPKSLICLPENPYLDSLENLKTSTGNLGVRWASIKSESVKWYSRSNLDRIPPQSQTSKGTLDDWLEENNTMVIVRANLFNAQTKWNVTAGTWFNTPDFDESNLPKIISDGTNMVGKIADLDLKVSWKNRLHGHLTSDVDSKMLISAISKDSIVLQNNILKPKSTTLPIGCIRNWLRMKHRRMSEERLESKFRALHDTLLDSALSPTSISILKEIARDFGDCEWVRELPMNIEVSGLSELGMISITEYVKEFSERGYVVEWNWPIINQIDFLTNLLNSENCLLVITKVGDLTKINSARGHLKSLPQLGQVELIISREHSINIQLTKEIENKPLIVHTSIPSNAQELLDSYSNGAWDISILTEGSTDFESRNKIWQAMYLFPNGDEEWANLNESASPLAAWIASPALYRPSRWARIGNYLTGEWADLLPFADCSIESLIAALPKAGPIWKSNAIRYIADKFVESNQNVLSVSHHLDNLEHATSISICLLLVCDRLPNDFDDLINKSIDYWLDAPLYAEDVLEVLFDKSEENLEDRFGLLDKVLKASKIHPTDSVLYNWGVYVNRLKLGENISNEEMRFYMSSFPHNWWFAESSKWLISQLSTASGRRWLAENELPWPALVARLEGELCGPPGFRKKYSREIPISDDILYIPILPECKAKDYLMDVYEMVVSLEDNSRLPNGRTHPKVGLLVRDFSEWPELSAEVISEGDAEIGSLLFGMSFHNRIL